MKKALIIFIKNPVSGKVKTRLAGSIGDARALSVYQQLLEYTRNITKVLPCDKLLFYNSFIDNDDSWNNTVYRKYCQTGNDLGEKMLNAFISAFNSGYEKVVIIGSDCIELESKIIADAFTFLETNDVIIGPAKDGGYYLLGMNQLYPEIFENKNWSTSMLLKETVLTLENKGLRYHQLETLNDIDQLEDLKLHSDKIRID